MSTRNDILETLKQDIEDHISSAQGYYIDVAEVKRGIHKWQDMINKPAIAFWNYKDESEGDFGDDGARWLYIYLYGYTETDGMGNVDNIHKLAQSVEKFLFSSHSTYADETEIRDFIIYEGGVQDPSAQFRLEIRIAYYYDTENI